MTGSPARLHGLDALRAGALLLGILLHALLPFEPSGAWMIADSTSMAIAAPIAFAIHLFRMTLFMTLAGYFGALVLRRAGSRHYVRDRLLRILLPAIMFWPVSVLATGLLWEFNIAWRGLARPTPPVPSDADPFALFPVGVLWFLWTLLQSALVVVVGRLLLLRVVGRARAEAVAASIGRRLASPAGLLLAALPYLIGLLVQDGWIDGIRAPGTVRPEPGSFIPYLGAFLVGWMLFAAGDRGLRRLADRWVVYAGAALATTVAAYLLSAAPAPLIIAAPLTALAGWTWVYALLGAGVGLIRRERAVVRYLADGSYWAYLLHLPLVLLAGILVADLAWPAPLKLAVVLLSTGMTLWLSYHLLVRSTVLGRWLNGRRYAFRWSLAPPVASRPRQ